jgi:hypothetical protein
MDDKAIWGLAGALFGWLLSTGTAFVKERMRIRSLAIGLRNELEDLLHQVRGVVESQKRSLHKIGAGVMSPAGSTRIHHSFYQQVYKEVFPSLGQGLRLSYQQIHASVDRLIEECAELDSLAIQRVAMKDGQSDEAKKLEERWRLLVPFAFGNASELCWYIERHLSGRALNPVLPFDEDHRAWHKNRKEVLEAIEGHIADGKAIDPAKFAARHDEDHFSRLAEQARRMKVKV